ncbi:hypothetical protein TSH7_09945 [Azospirillum sp. TSH7]|uniref:hypothetical protein n=1 Tax=unclassified Azospirillum TaxID=2630922 RepID=UPI000D618213|nr:MULTISPECIES: hypothetical protein [unclassified Azospirillum]PWC63990.1 hypothetical protein TSH20_19040 [Azospirillum sp. TSH20]PWC64853.1 hypothetical protein TSH7_09945 [Azospirillum sp. TSH7]
MNDVPQDVMDIAADYLGPAPQAPASAPAPAGMGGELEGPAEPGGDNAREEAGERRQAAKSSPEDAAITAGAPNDDADAVAYEIDFGETAGGKRKLSPQQIKSTFERYSALNQRHATLKPGIELMQALIDKSGQPPEAVTAFLIDALKGKIDKGTGTTGGQDPAKGEGAPGGAHPFDPTALDAWEKENAVTLPPGYKEGAGTIAALQRQVGELSGMLQQVLGQGAGMVDASRQAMQQATGMQTNALRAAIGQNLGAAQMKYQLPDDSQNDFLSFAAERGFTMEDFVDPTLTDKVVGDFSAVRSTPEMERLRGIHQRRQAFTGGIGSAPSAGGTKPKGGGDEEFASMLDHVYSKR